MGKSKNNSNNSNNVKQDIKILEYNLSFEAKKLFRKINNSINEGKFFDKAGSHKTHNEKHTESDMTKTLSALLSADRLSHNSDPKLPFKYSCFKSEEYSRFCIEEVILSNAATIADWVSRGGKKQRPFDERLKQGYDEPVGYGYIVNDSNNSVSEYTTYDMRVVLESDNTAPLGFTLVTAFPYTVPDENRRATGRDISEMAKLTDAYKKASPTKKAYIEYQTGNYKKPYKAILRMNNGVESIRAYIPLKQSVANGSFLNRNHVLTVKLDNIMLYTTQGNDGNKINTCYTDSFCDDSSKEVDLTMSDARYEFAKENMVAMKLAVSFCESIVNHRRNEILSMKKDMDNVLLSQPNLSVEKEEFQM